MKSSFFQVPALSSRLPKMLNFDAKDPFPLAENASYAEAQEHSEHVDQWLGLKTHEIEAALVGKNAKLFSAEKDRQQWIGLPVKTLLTPYTEIRSILERLGPKAGDHVIDLGAGYGRMAFVIERHFPEVRFTGYEIVKERVDEGLRCLKEQTPFSAKNQLKHADLTDPHFHLEQAECYFLYDFGTREAIDKTLEDLKEVARSNSIKVVGRGRASRDAIERNHPWLSQIVQARHYGNYSLYQSC
jgi:hypothetical protein